MARLPDLGPMRAGTITAIRGALHGHQDHQARDDLWKLAESDPHTPTIDACLRMMLLDLEQQRQAYQPSPFEAELIGDVIASNDLLLDLWSGRRRGKSPSSTAWWFGKELERQGLPRPFVGFAVAQLEQRMEAGNGN